VLLATGLAACQHDVASTDGAFYDWSGRRLHCAVDIDDSTRNDFASIETGLDRARDRGEVLELYAHHPGVTLSWDTIDKVFAAAQERGLPFITYGDLARGTAPSGGLLFSFDDSWVDAWTSGREIFQRYGARVTFFIAYYPKFTDAMKAELQQLAADGHDIEAHSITHSRAPEYVESKGLAAYIDEDVVPSIDLLRRDGYDVTAFAYPFGSRTEQTDRAIFEHVDLIRSVAFTWSGVESPCPF